MNTVTFTHKGWFGLCPVYFADLNSDAPHVHERHWALKPLMVVSEWMWGAMFWLASVVNPDYEPEWPLHITGVLDPPISFEAHETP